MFSIPQTAFFLLFFSLLFLLLVFGETTYGIPLLGALVLLCLVSIRWTKLQVKKSSVLPLLFFGGYTVWSAVSLLQTVSVPLTLSALMFTASSFVLFFFVTNRNTQILPSSMLLLGSCILAAVFSVLTFIYTLFPGASQFLPSVTLLTAYYGHNQAALLFLMTIPLLWVFAEQKKSFFARYGLLLVIAGLFLSFARAAIVLGAVEILLLWRTTQDVKLRRLGRVLSLSAFLVVSIVVLLSAFAGKNAESCPFPVYQQQLCKPVHTELRPAYWMQAIEAWQEKPISGWGGGTFSIISAALQKVPGHYTGYAHNEFLQAFAEYGVLGGALFLGFCLSLLVHAVRQFQSTSEQRLHQRKQFALALGICFAIALALIDFSWHMIGLWLFFLVLVGSWLSESHNDHGDEIPTLLRATTKLLRVEVVLVSTAVIVWSLAFIASTVLWQKAAYEQSIQLFPFAYWRVEDVLRSDAKVRPETRSWLLSLYGHHYRMWLAAAEQSGEKEKAELYQKAIQLDPLSQQRRLMYLQAEYDAKNWDAFMMALQEWYELQLSGELKDIEYEEHGKVAQLAIQAAHHVYVTDRYRGVQLYILGYQIQPGQFGVTDLVLFSDIERIPIDQLIPLLDTVNFVDVWKYSTVIADRLAGELTTALAQGKSEQSVRLTQLMLKFDERTWYLEEIITKEWYRRAARPETYQPNPLHIAVVESYMRSIAVWEAYTKLLFNPGVKSEVSAEWQRWQTEQAVSSQE